ncbi:hypothetical protein [Clostridium botulinum]|uniref:hypothetical protein n=1 Tax=Clostridium botulinum TaxID=1491 RepID=UPI00246900A4|nr:hypothetical protein [Clostridium botulinum]
MLFSYPFLGGVQNSVTNIQEKSRDKPKNNFIGSAYSFFFGGTSSGKIANERTAMQITCKIFI